jgi:hypothetical protein
MVSRVIIAAYELSARNLHSLVLKERILVL